MRYLFLAASLFAILVSCQSNSKKPALLNNPDDLKADEYTINTDRDTTIETKNGALLNIPKGSLQANDGNTVTLEIKEAYSIQQMIKSGLMTTSNGEPLSSGGMIYINAKGGQGVRITQAIKVALPADYLDKKMQLFKGEKTADGAINWTEPKQLSENKQLNAMDQGRALFVAQCASCHVIGKDATGPNLAHFPKRIEIGEGTSHYWHHDFRKYYTPYTVDPVTDKRDSMYRERWVDPYACNLISMYGSYGPPFDTTWPVMKAVYDYIQNESDRLNLPLPSHAYLKDCTDSCGLYSDVTKELRQRKANAKNKRDRLAADADLLVRQKLMDSELTVADANAAVAPPPPVNYDEKVSPEYSRGVYYQFTIETFGWYNIDVLLKNVDGNRQSELFVRMIGAYREKIDLFLIIPSSKIYVQGGSTGNRDEYAFDNKDGSIVLPQNAKAFIVAMKEVNSSIAFAIKEFTTRDKQQLEITLQESTIEAFNRSISVIGGENIKIEAAKSKHADEIRKFDADIHSIDQQLKDAEKLKPKRCDCECGVESDRALFAIDTAKQ